MISVPRRLASSTIAVPALRPRTRRGMTEMPYDSPIRRASSSSWSAIAIWSGSSALNGRSSGTSSTWTAAICAPRSAARLAATSKASSVA